MKELDDVVNRFGFEDRSAQELRSKRNQFSQLILVAYYEPSSR